MVGKESYRKLSCIVLSVFLVEIPVAKGQFENYGVDVSAPMHHAKVSTNYAEYPWNSGTETVPTEFENMVVQPLGNRQAWYDEMIKGCVEYYGKDGHVCLGYETDRIEMNLRQPASMENYTDIGFKKIRAPNDVWKLVKDFWDNNKNDKSPENWPKGNSYTNHWSSPTYTVNIENSKLRGGGFPLRQSIWDAAKSTIANWTHSTVHDVSLYGIRVYTRGSVLASHVDRLPLVASAIICVDTNVEEPWPLEVIGHDGRAHNVTMEPGDMVLYESHSIIHGRPFPLKGEYVANLFVHFEPENHSEKHGAKMSTQRRDTSNQYKEDIARGIAGHEGDNHVKHESESDLPIYVIPGSAEAALILKEHGGHEEEGEQTVGATDAHHFAAAGKVKELAQVIDKDQNLVLDADENGWTPIHEAARSGNVEVVRYLLEKGADINHRTGEGDGYSALAIAQMELGSEHSLTKFLESSGGIFFEPEL